MNTAPTIRAVASVGRGGDNEEPQPQFDVRGPDADEFGAAAGYPMGDRVTYFATGSLVGSHSHLDEIFPGRLVRKAPTPSRLARVAEPRITWTFEGAQLTLDDYLARNPTTGLLVARGDTIFVERYQYGRTDRHRFTSWSMAKTVTAMLVGIAISEGDIRSIDDLAAAYVPELATTEYGRTSIRDLLQMSSGVRFSEEYSGRDDIATLAMNTYRLLGAGGPSAVTPFNERDAPPGTKFSYASAETQVLGLVLARASGRPVAEYLEQKIWQPMGAEADATWLIDNSGQEVTFCGLNAVLRDYARLGCCWPTTVTGTVVSSFLRRGSWPRRRSARINRICGPARPRPSSATATRRGSCRPSAGCSCSGAFAGSGSSSTLKTRSSS
jgi:CubicO group peptidase (beta-lactamase class C family)